MKLKVFALLGCFFVTNVFAELVEGEFEIRNQRDKVMTGLYVDFSHDTDPDWGSNILAKTPVKRLEAGEGIVITVDNRQGFCHYDILAVWEDGVEQQASDVDVCNIDHWDFE